MFIVFKGPSFNPGMINGQLIAGAVERLNSLRACINTGKGKFGLINMAGEVVIKLKGGHTGQDFHDGLAGVRKKEKWGFIDQTGKSVISPKFGRINRFVDGVCSVMVGG